jgi:hypothetical protein
MAGLGVYVDDQRYYLIPLENYQTTQPVTAFTFNPPISGRRVKVQKDLFFLDTSKNKNATTLPINICEVQVWGEYPK